MADDVFAWPPDVEWRPVSGKLATAWRIQLGLWQLPVLIGAALVWWLLWPWLGALILLVSLAAGGWTWFAVGRVVRAYGYAERVDDLMVRHGLLVRRLSVVPYGRMQFVDVNAGPIDRWLGIATVQLHTAAAASDAAVPGLPPAEAARLRDRLASHGEARAAGL